MKVLILNPQWSPGHPLVRALELALEARLGDSQRNEVTMLYAGRLEEAWLILQMHGSELDLCIIHREVQGEQGLTFVKQVRRYQGPKRIPILMTSRKWGENEFAEHRKSGSAVEGYLAVPCTEQQMLSEVAKLVPGIMVTAPKKAEPAAAIAPPAPPVVSGSGDYEVLKTYLMLRERDVLLLGNQVKEAIQAMQQENLRRIEAEHALEIERRKNAELEEERKMLLDAIETHYRERKQAIDSKAAFESKLVDVLDETIEQNDGEDEVVYFLKRGTTATN